MVNSVCIGMTSGIATNNGTIIVAGEVVAKSIPDNCIAAGSPAKIIGNIEDYEKNILYIT